MAGLLDWYEPRRRAYPWRGAPEPFGVLVAEVMLQQTQVGRVVPIWERFVDEFPTAAALASAPVSSALRAWAGLGYNRRAPALHQAAGAIVMSHGGLVPRDPAALRALPGVGAYTAAAVASCAYGVAVAAVDVNVRRVVSRARLGVEPSAVGGAAAGASVIAGEAQAWLDRRDPGAWNQALMDVGREHCRAEPRCDGCPLRAGCRFRMAGQRAGQRREAWAAGRRPEPFAGSNRQLRGRIVQALREAPSGLVADLAQRWAESPARVSAAVEALAAEGLVSVEPGGQVRLGV